MSPLVSIIVPVYGVEKYIEKSITSLINQTYENIEIIIIDDRSPDNSMKVLKQVLFENPTRSNKVKILQHSENKGLPTARNTGLDYASGKYIYHCDSDDWIEPNMIKDLVLLAETYKADIVYCDFLLTFKNNERYMAQKPFSETEQILKATLTGVIKYNVWNKLVLKELYDKYNVRFPDGYSMGEDMTMIKLLCHAKIIKHQPKAYYHYVQSNPNAHTKQFDAVKLNSVDENTKKTIDYLIKNGCLDNSSKKYIEFFKLNVKLPLLVTSGRNNYKYWNSWFANSNQFIWDKDNNMTFRIKLIQWLAHIKMYFLIQLHFFLIYKVYGLIYKQ